ncbi:unnamed protein product [Pieris macdunnoughi]|uniref:Uncharacterized protein n=1 Tax=Pieris macdunnoughi TaxID=345717 RepID=A0A821UJM3_9NEOP|nr:unnamed protein product [Pieris macdunnoughi]
MLKIFWEIEPNTIGNRLSKEEEFCENLYDYADQDRRFIVKLPFMTENPQCRHGNLREIAAKRFEILEKKLSRNQKLK